MVEETMSNFDIWLSVLATVATTALCIIAWAVNEIRIEIITATSMMRFDK
jgi:hypothetical protein